MLTDQPASDAVNDCPGGSAFDRRRFLSFSTAGIGAVALAELLIRDGVAEADSVPGQAPVPWPHHEPRAKRVIHVVACGGFS